MFAAIPLFTLCATVALPGQTKQTVLHFDAMWWINDAPDTERDGFLYGYRDCVQPHGAASGSIVEYRELVTKLLSSGAPSSPRSVTSAIHTAWKTLNAPPPLVGGEVYDGPHGFLDGSWWGGFAENNRPREVAESDRGYLEGYLACAAPPVTEDRVRRLQAAVNTHYATGEHESDFIAVVVHRLVKRETSKKP
jgi:hypothetical protein